MARGGLRVSTKRIQIDKANSTIVIAVGIAAFATAFSLVATKSLLAKQSYQNKVIAAREQARDQLDANIAAVDDLKIKYAEFVERQENIIKGSSSGTGERDGDNARIVLDALPSKYDFPALASSLEKILVDRNYSIESISGVDDEAAHSAGDMAAMTMDPALAGVDPAAVAPPPASGTGQAMTAGPTSAVEMPFEIGAAGNYKGMIDLLGVFGRSIRPIYVQTLQFSAGDGDQVQLSIQGKTYFQPERTLNITDEVVQ